ncbi:multi-sensor signal transduction multi-kinase [Leptolyngbya sp. Heron Island J]|uniref:AAA family ATPase n=1 Tax=Leptolyngbya sp. Heron Island J TaxID=1385935 RepID=UPI0003B99B09|nr:AAA family ATPase [Leptolyngbya sp. Heron Island J]ESA37110.1 multi-sensor signal transduction multi-kinase [Leptolyngbya sp. Heron Island J]
MTYALRQTAIDNSDWLLGYKISACLYSNHHTQIYRAVRQSDQQAVILKLLNNPSPSFKELIRFRNQYTVTQQLQHPGIVRVEALLPSQRGWVLVMTAAEQTYSLKQYLLEHRQKTSRGLPLSTVLIVGIHLADVLSYLGQQRIIHKNIQPAHILIHPDTLQIQLIDFGLATLLPQEIQELRAPTDLEGTLAYMAPEQTGRMNRGIDYRADFYSLGVTLYELLTGQRPFQASETDALGLIYGHLAQRPVPPSEMMGCEPMLPTVVSDIVLKLLAKNAEDRYQSGLGLKYDLEQCLSQWQTTQAITSFALGQRDRCDRILPPQHLYGRTTEVNTLLAAFEQVAAGSTEILLVAGFSGIGKTAVVHEVHKPITRQKGYFIQGKFDQFNRSNPLSAFLQAFRSLIGQLLGESDVALSQWKTKILDVVGESGQVLIDVIPELEYIIGQQPTVPELSSSAAQKRFNLLFSQFVHIFTKKEHPLVIFLDDLQWADATSLNLLQILVTQVETESLLVLGAYRDNEVFSGHPLMLALDKIREHNATLKILTLAPLTATDTTQLITDILRCSSAVAAQLSQLLYAITQGNPFFTLQFLQSLYEKRYIRFDATTGDWQGDLAQIQTLALTDNVVDFIVDRLLQLPEPIQEILKIAACIGNRFNLETLKTILNRPQQDIAKDLWQLLKTGLIVPEDNTYKFFGGADARDGFSYKMPSNSNGPRLVHPLDQQSDFFQGHDLEYEIPNNLSVGYRFLHDRVQQAAYTLIPTHQKAITHYRIGNLLYEQLVAPCHEQRIFEVVRHLNYGIPFISVPDERDRLAHLNLLAGQRAKAATAYDAGQDYVNTGLLLLGKTAWQRDYATSLALHELAAELAYLTGQPVRMNRLVAIISQQARQDLDTVKALQIQIQHYTVQGEFILAIDNARHLLQKLGIELPSQPSLEDVEQEFHQFKHFVKQFTPDEIAERPLLTNPQQLAAASTLMAIGPAAVITDYNLFWLIILALVKLSLEHGNSVFSPYGYVCYGILLNRLERDIETFYQLGQTGLKILQRFEQSDVKCKVFQVVGAYTTHIKFHVQQTFPLLDKAYTSGLESGDFEFAGYAIFVKCQNQYLMGQLLPELTQQLSDQTQALQAINQKTALNWHQLFVQVVTKLLGQDTLPSEFGSESMDVDQLLQTLTESKDDFGIHYLYFHQATLKYLFADLPQALHFSQLAANYLHAPMGLLVEYTFYFYDSLIHLGCILSSEGPENTTRSHHLARVDHNQARMTIWADYAPMNFQHKFDLVEAEKHRILGNRVLALDLYDRAIAGAKANGYIQEEALANELAAKFYLEWGKENVAAGYMQAAHACYQRWGSQAKTKDLEQHYPHLLQPVFPVHPTEFVADASVSHFSTDDNNAPNLLNPQPSPSDWTLNTADFIPIMQSAQTLAQSTDLSALIQQLIQLSLISSGAQTCMVAYHNLHNEWVIQGNSLTTDITATHDQPSIMLVTPNAYPTHLIHWTKNTKTAITIDGHSPLAIVDQYLLDHQPQSAFCAPILKGETVLGVLYLEHRQATNIFTKQDQVILSFICAQAAIALENANLHQTVQTLTIEKDSRTTLLPGVIFQLRQDTDGRLSFPYIGATCHELCQLSAAAITANAACLFSLIHPEDTTGAQAAIEQSAQTLTPVVWAGRFILPSGDIQALKIAARPQADDQGNIIWDGVLAEDIQSPPATYYSISHLPSLSAIIEQDTSGQYPESHRLPSLPTPEQSMPFLERFTAALVDLLPKGQCSAVNVAKQLGVSARTLRRRLQAEGTTFKAAVSQMRLALAKHYLCQSDLTCKHISTLIGYDNPSSFTRAFHAAMGITPEEFRKSQG